MANILVTSGIPSEGLDLLAEHTVRIPEAGKAFSREEILTLLPDTDAVLACRVFDREMIEAAPRLKIIVCYGAGYDKIDVSAATERGIPVCNIPHTVTASTAETTFALMLSLARRVCEKDRLLRAGNAEKLFVMGYEMGTSLIGATLGLIGMGRIGSRVADLAHAFGMKVLYNAHAPKPEREALGDTFVPIDTLLRESDFVSLHCPLTEETRGLLSAERIALMKPTAFLINTARGAVADEDSLIEAVCTRRIAGAALDVYPAEPKVNPEWLTLPNVVLTPHIGSNTRQTRCLMARTASQTILDRLNGKRPPDLLNPETLP